MGRVHIEHDRSGRDSHRDVVAGVEQLINLRIELFEFRVAAITSNHPALLWNLAALHTIVVPVRVLLPRLASSNLAAWVIEEAAALDAEYPPNPG